jgi:hypothetical protein
MALGFNNQAVNFGNVDYSGYVHGAGAAMGGLNQGLGAVLQGVQQRAAERKQKEREKKMRDDLAPLVEQMSGGQINIKDVSPEALPMLWDRAQQMEQQRAQQAEQGRMVETINGLARRPMNQETILGMQQAGVDPKVIGMLVEMSKPKEAPWQPTAVDVGGNPMVMTSPSSAQIVRAPEPAPGTFEPRVIEQGGVKLYEREPGKFDQVAAPRANPAGGINYVQQSIMADIATTEQQILAEQQASDNGDPRSGVWWNEVPRSQTIAQLNKKLEGLRARLEAMNQGGGSASAGPTAGPAPAAPVAPAAAASAPAAPGYEQTKASFFSRLKQ